MSNPPPTATSPFRPWHAVTLMVTLAFGYWWPLFSSTDFPLGDGGMFYRVIETISTHGLLPATIDWNGHTLPFAYPPLGFWLYAGLHHLGFDILVLMHWVPFITVLIALACLALYCQRRIADPFACLLACALLALTPKCFEWTAMGGGVTRATGMALAMAALLCADHLRDKGTWRWRIITGLLVGLCLLSHPEWGITCVLLVTLTLLPRRDWRQTAIDLPSIGLISAGVIAPWLLAIISTHGSAPFTKALGSGGFAASAGSNTGFATDATWSDLFTLASPPSLLNGFPGEFTIGTAYSTAFLVAAFAIPALFLLMWKRDRLFFVGLIVFLAPLTTPRHSPTIIVIFATILSAPAIILILGGGFSSVLKTLPTRWDADAWYVPSLFAIAIPIAFTAHQNLHFDRPSSPLYIMPDDHRDMMHWMDANIPANARIITMNDRYACPIVHFSSEWLPALTKLHVSHLPQGQEWISFHDFSIDMRWIGMLQNSLLQAHGTIFKVPDNDYVVIFYSEPDARRFQLPLPKPKGWDVVYETSNAVCLKNPAPVTTVR